MNYSLAPHTMDRHVDQKDDPTLEENEDPAKDDDSMNSGDSNSIGPPQTYRYPQFDPGCSTDQYEQIRDFLFANRQQLALDSLYFDMPEHLILAYINRLGTDLQPSIWRGFLLSCGGRRQLFRYGSFPPPKSPMPNRTTGTGRLVPLQHQLHWR